MDIVEKILSAETVELFFGHKRNGQPRSVVDLIKWVVKNNKKKDKDLYKALKPKKKNKNKDNKLDEDLYKSFKSKKKGKKNKKNKKMKKLWKYYNK